VTEPSRPVALVLGATGVLGSAVSRAFLTRQFEVIGTGFQHMPQGISGFRFDATSADGVDHLQKWLESRTERIDVAVHGIGANRDAWLMKMSDAEWMNVMQSHLKSAYLLSKMLVTRMMKQRSGHLIFITSWAGLVGRAGQANYSAAKAGVIALAQSIAREYAPRGILANVIVPGVFPSVMTEALNEKQLEALWEDSAMKGFADLNEIAEFIVHLASMKKVTGQVFHLDGRIAPVLG